MKSQIESWAACILVRIQIVTANLDPRQNSNRHRELGSRGPAVARRNCYCAASLALRSGTAVLVGQRKWPGRALRR
jgi:hypothetical protein